MLYREWVGLKSVSGGLVARNNHFYFLPTDNGVYICEDCALEEYKELPEEKKINFIYYWLNG